MRRKFLGRFDPDRIMLQDVFYTNDRVTVSTPLDEQGKVHRVFIEALPGLTDFLRPEIGELVMRSQNLHSESGRWCGFMPDGDTLIVLTFERTVACLSNLTLLSQVLYMDLAQICNLHVSDNSFIQVFCGNQLTCGQLVHLPLSVANGSRSIPRIHKSNLSIS